MGYAEGQNEPSQPIPRIIEIPDDVAERNALLKNLFNTQVCADTHVCGSDDGGEFDVKVTEGGKGHYGDLIVEPTDGSSVYLFVTYIEE